MVFIKNFIETSCLVELNLDLHSEGRGELTIIAVDDLTSVQFNSIKHKKKKKQFMKTSISYIAGFVEGAL